MPDNTRFFSPVVSFALYLKDRGTILVCPILEASPPRDLQWYIRWHPLLLLLSPDRIGSNFSFFYQHPNTSSLPPPKVRKYPKKEKKRRGSLQTKPSATGCFDTMPVRSGGQGFLPSSIITPPSWSKRSWRSCRHKFHPSFRHR